MINTAYKGYTLQFDEQEDEWTVHIGNTSMSNKSLKSLKKRIDSIDKKDFERVPVWIMSYVGTFEEAEVTSEMEYNRGYDSKIEIWVVTKKGKRSKHEASDLLVVSPQNTNLIAEIAALDAQMKILHQKKSDLRMQFEHYTPRKKVSK